jgi:hypothetical protein
MNHVGSSVLAKFTVTLEIFPIIAKARNLALARSLHLESLGLPGFCLFSLRHFGNFSSHSRRTTAKTESDSSKATIQFQFAPMRGTQNCVLEAKGCSPRQSTFQLAETVAQVAA